MATDQPRRARIGIGAYLYDLADRLDRVAQDSGDPGVQSQLKPLATEAREKAAIVESLFQLKE